MYYAQFWFGNNVKEVTNLLKNKITIFTVVEFFTNWIISLTRKLVISIPFEMRLV